MDPLYQQIYCPHCSNIMYLTSTPFGEQPPSNADPEAQISPGLFASPNLESAWNNSLISLSPALNPRQEPLGFLHAFDISHHPPDIRCLLHLRFGGDGMAWEEVASEYGRAKPRESPSSTSIQMKLSRLRSKCSAVDQLYRNHSPRRKRRRRLNGQSLSRFVRLRHIPHLPR